MASTIFLPTLKISVAETFAHPFPYTSRQSQSKYPKKLLAAFGKKTIWIKSSQYGGGIECCWTSHSSLWGTYDTNVK